MQGGELLKHFAIEFQGNISAKESEWWESWDYYVSLRELERCWEQDKIDLDSIEGIDWDSGRTLIYFREIEIPNAN